MDLHAVLPQPALTECEEIVRTSSTLARRPPLSDVLCEITNDVRKNPAAQVARTAGLHNCYPYEVGLMSSERPLGT